MNYSSSLRYLNSFLNLERIQLSSPRIWNLKRMRWLLDWAGHPEKSFFPVLIAGTKGKGSTGFFLESILAASKIPVGFYSSPHLEDPRERIRINGKIVSKEMWVEGMRNITVPGTLRDRSPRRPVPAVPGTGACNFTYFEIMTLLAMLLFKRAGVRIGIFEVGMGGRLDATNTLSPKLAILTPIYLDHEAILGNTIAKIAREKAAIIKRNAHVVVAPQPREAMREIEKRVRKMRARMVPSTAGEMVPGTLRDRSPRRPVPAVPGTTRGNVPDTIGRVGLRGDYQITNAAAAVKAAEILRDPFGFPVTQKGIAQGLKAKNWPGRFEILKSRGVEFLLDGAHNPMSVRAFVRNLERLYPNRRRLLVFGTSRDKKAGQMLALLGRAFDEAVLTQAPNPRSAEVETLLLQARPYFKKIYPFGTVPAALEFARQKPGAQVVVTGSFYLIGEARKYLRA